MKTEDYKAMIEGKIFYLLIIIKEPMKKEDHTTGSLFDYPYFKKSCILIAKDLSKQQAVNSDPNLTENLENRVTICSFFNK